MHTSHGCSKQRRNSVKHKHEAVSVVDIFQAEQFPK